MEFARDPIATETGFQKTTLAGIKGEVISRNDDDRQRRKDYQRVERVMKEVVGTCQTYIDAEIKVLERVSKSNRNNLLKYQKMTEEEKQRLSSSSADSKTHISASADNSLPPIATNHAPSSTPTIATDAAASLNTTTTTTTTTNTNDQKLPRLLLTSLKNNVVDRSAAETEFSHLEIESSLEHLRCVKARLAGTWSLVYNTSQSINAFVTDYCPKKIFVNEGLVKAMKPSDEELALILFHEVSHLILGHSIAQSKNTGFALGLELVILTFIDPIGFYSFFLEFLASQFRDILIASYSREHESEADFLGINLMAYSKFDVVKGSNIFKKFIILESGEKIDSPSIEEVSISSPPVVPAPVPVQQLPSNTSSADVTTPGTIKTSSKDKQGKLQENHAGWSDSHPSSYDRYVKLSEMASQLQELQKKSVTSNSNGTIFYYVKYLTDLLIAPQGLLEAPVATKTS